MLTYLEIEGKTITADAMHCQRENCRKIQEISWLKEHKWSGLQSVFSIERMVDVRRHHSKETSYYISSRDVSVKQLMELAREH